MNISSSAGSSGGSGAGTAAGGMLDILNDLIKLSVEDRRIQDERTFRKGYVRQKYQYTTQDLRKAGLSPLLAFHGLGPGGATSIQTQTGAFSGKAMAPTLQKSAIIRDQLKTGEKQRNLLDSQRFKNEQDTNTSTAIEARELAQEELLKGQKNALHIKVLKDWADANLSSAKGQQAMLQNIKLRAQSLPYKKYKGLTGYLDYILGRGLSIGKSGVSLHR